LKNVYWRKWLMLDQMDNESHAADRRTFVIRLWRDKGGALELRGEARRVGREQPVYIRSAGELLDYIQLEMAAPNCEPNRPRPSGLR
jgi:hypothetical protein